MYSVKSQLFKSGLGGTDAVIAGRMDSANFICIMQIEFSVAGYRTIHGINLTYHSQRQRASGDLQLVQAAGGIYTAANPLLLNMKVGHDQICALENLVPAAVCGRNWG